MKTGQKFRAYLKVESPGKEHFGSPFVCITDGKKRIEADDKFGFRCLLKHDYFTFVPGK